MNKKRLKTGLISLLITLAFLSGCSYESKGIDYTGIEINVDTSENAILDLTVPYYGYEISTLNPFHTTDGMEIGLNTNLYSGLVSYDVNKKIIPEIAVSWEASDDYKTWTFHLRDDVYWVNYLGEKQDLITSDDFLTGMEWLMNYSKNEGYSLNLALSFIEGAADYLDYTLALPDEEARCVPRETFLDMVGIEAPDEFTVVYTCIESCPFFLSLASNNEFLPLSKKHVSEIGIDAMKVNSYYDAWYNGPYLLTEFIPSNVRILDPNPYWHGNAEHTRFKSVTMRYMESSSVAFQLYKTGELDYVELYESQVRTILSDEKGKYYDKLVQGIPSSYSEQVYFNFYKLDEDGNIDEKWGRAIANEAFRLSWYYGLDMYDVLKNRNNVNPLSCETNTLTAKNAFSLLNGTDYTELVIENLNLKESDGEHLRRLDRELFLKYKAQAIEELTAEGISFPIVADYYVKASDQSVLDEVLLLKGIIEESLGSDYVTLNIKTYVSSFYREVFMPRTYSFVIDMWGADYEDPSSILEQYLADNDYSNIMKLIGLGYYSEETLPGELSYMRDTVEVCKQYGKLFREANEITSDTDARYKAFAETESLLLKHAICIPCICTRGWVLTKINLKMRAAEYGCYIDRYIDIKTDKNGYTDAMWGD